MNERQKKIVFFRDAASLHPFRANRKKVQILPTRSIIQVHTWYASLQYPGIFQTDLRSLDLSYREKLMELL